MSRTHKRVISTLVAVFLLAHLSVLVTKHQHWPVLSYPMYSFNVADGLHCPVVFAVPQDPAQPEARVTSDQTGVHFQMTMFALRKMLQYPYRQADYDTVAAGCPEATRDACASQRLVGDTLHFLFDQYNANRAESHAPPIKALRVYDVDYTPLAFGRWELTAKRLRAEWPAP